MEAVIRWIRRVSNLSFEPEKRYWVETEKSFTSIQSQDYGSFDIMDEILVPVNYSDHWVLVRGRTCTRSLSVYDSYGEGDEKAMK